MYFVARPCCNASVVRNFATHMIKHKFKLNISIQIDNSVKFGSISDKFRNIEMFESADGKMDLIVTKRLTFPIELSINEATAEVNDLVDRLALIDNHKIDSLEYLGYEDENANFIQPKKNVVIKAELGCLIQNAQKYYENSDRKKLLTKTNNQGLLRIYRLGLGIEDKITQYLLFYGIILIINNETQIEVDKYILRAIPDIQLVDGKHRQETILTKIRNMISHPGKDIDISELYLLAENYCETVRGLALKALRE
jgi:hypothetical protein